MNDGAEMPTLDLSADIDRLGETALKLKRRHEKLLAALREIFELDSEEGCDGTWRAVRIAERAIDEDAE
jgi:hypothetical protein